MILKLKVIIKIQYATTEVGKHPIPYLIHRSTLNINLIHYAVSDVDRKPYRMIPHLSMHAAY